MFQPDLKNSVNLKRLGKGERLRNDSEESESLGEDSEKGGRLQKTRRIAETRMGVLIEARTRR